MADTHDTSSQIATKARNLTVFDDNDEFAGAAQVFTTQRGVEVEAIKNAMNPRSEDDTWTEEELEADMRTRGYVRCHGRCKGAFKHKSEFSTDERNPGRLYCKSYCKECEAGKIHRKRVANHDVQATQRYEYRKRRVKRKRKG